MINLFKDIFIQPTNGLGNRLRLIESYYKFCSFKGCKLNIYWTSSPGFSEEKFQDLFNIDTLNKSIINFISKDQFLEVRKNVFCLDDFVFQNDHSEHIVKNKDLIMDKIINSSLCFRGSICLNHVFEYDNIINKIHRKFKPNCFTSSLKPSHCLENEVKNIINYFNSDVLGVHIRRGDAINGLWKDKYLFSTDEMFCEKIEEHNGFVFLSTDCERTQSKFLSKFGNKIIYNPQKKFNNPNQNILEEKLFQKDAVVDMFCLSACSKMIGTNWSSFSEIASVIGRGVNSTNIPFNFKINEKEKI